MCHLLKCRQRSELILKYLKKNSIFIHTDVSALSAFRIVKPPPHSDVLV